MIEINPVELAQALIRCPSVTPEDAGAQQVLVDALTPLGFDCKNLPFGNIRNLYARFGTGTPHFCFCGHTDVVPVGDETRWTYPPFAAQIHDGLLYGRGAADMKSNIAAFAAATALFLSESHDFNGSISFLITGDEEAEAVNGTVKVLAWMKENGEIPDACLIGEPTSPNALGDEIKVGRRGSISGEITVTGKQGHTGYPHLADNPLPRLARMVDALASHKFDDGTEFFEPSALSITTIDVGNPADNVIPGKGRAKFNMRFNDLWSAKKLENEIRAILDKVTPDYEIRFWSNAESFITRPGPLSEITSAAVQAVTGRKPRLSTAGGTSDARFVANYCPEIECGLVGKTCHQVDEHVAVADIEKLAQIYAEILRRYFAAAG